jgi:hypothetical protein
MRPLRFVWICCLFFLVVPVRSQQSQTPSQTASAGQTNGSAIIDPQAVTVLNRALANAGGAAAIAAVSDYTGVGSVAYPSDQGTQGTVTVFALGGTEFRMDSNLPSGKRSWAVSDGIVSTKDENGTVSSQAPKSTLPSSDAFPHQSPQFPTSLAFPYEQLATVLSSSVFNITYEGTTQVDGHSVHDVQLQHAPIGSPAPGRFMLPEPTREIFIDTSTFEIVMMKETLPKGVVHQVHYSNYQLVRGLLLPFAISEDIAGQPIWAIQFTQFSFNTGLQASSFALE